MNVNLVTHWIPVFSLQLKMSEIGKNLNGMKKMKWKFKTKLTQ